MQTGDGLLVRLLPIGTIRLEAMRTLCEAARAFGNGVIEITARGSIQIRGLRADTAPRFADAIAALGIAAQDGVPVICNALAGLDAEEIVDAAALAADLRAALTRTAPSERLAPKISVVIDGGGLDLDDIAADVRLRAIAGDDGAVLELSVGGDAAHATKLGAVTPSDGIAAVIRLLTVIGQHGRTTRARDVITTDGAHAFSAAVDDLLVNGPSVSARAFRQVIGTHVLRDGSLAVGLGLPFGHSDARTLEHLTDAATSVGAVGMRTAAGRVLMIVSVPPPNAPDLLKAAHDLGFIVAAADPRRHVFACAGAPACASAYIAARSLAAEVADIAAPHLDRDFQIHVSGCGKGCAHPAAAALTVVGEASGCALIANGTARDTPFAVVAPDDLPAAVTRHLAQSREVGHV
jgi:precorrin-3B synthase